MPAVRFRRYPPAATTGAKATAAARRTAIRGLQRRATTPRSTP